MQRLLKTVFVIGIMLIIAGCSTGSANSQDELNSVVTENAEIDYETLPFSKIATRLNKCIENYQTVSYKYWVPTVSDAKLIGYGYIDSQINNSGNDDQKISINCAEMSEEISALSLAASLADNRENTSKVFKSWSECMDQKGYSGLVDPRSRKTVLAKKLYEPTVENTESVSETKQRGERLKEYEIKPHLDDIKLDQEDVLNEAPSDISALLKG